MSINTSVLDKITTFIVTNFLFGDLSRKPADNDSLIETGVVDSTGILELIEFLESEFGIEVNEDETIPQNLDGLAVAAHFVERKLKQV